MRKGPKVLDLEKVDEWAVGLVVREGVLMNLSRDEATIAVGRMREMGLPHQVVTARLRITVTQMEAMERRYRRFFKIDTQRQRVS